MESEKLESGKISARKPSGWGARHTLAALGFWSFAMSYGMRFNLSLAIVAMVNRTASHVEHSSDLDGEVGNRSIIIEACPATRPAGSGNMSHLTNSASSQGEFFWNEAEQGLILGAFFYGYIAMQLPGGMLAHRFGGKWPLGVGLLVTAIFTILTPWAARTSTSLLIFVRAVQGLGEGLGFPSMHTILASWAPPDERSKLGSIIYAGAQFGTAATMIIGGYLIDGEILGGWPALFYVTGAVTIVWFIFWCFLMYDTPAAHPRISMDELNYIEKAIGDQTSKTKIPAPWKSIFTSMPVYAIMIANFGHAWGLYTLLTMMPTYLKTVLHFDIKQNSWISAMPHLIMWILSISLSQVADLLISRKFLRTVTVRKVFNSIAHIGSALALIGASYSGCDSTTTVALLTVAVGIEGAVYGGFIVNHVDISPNHAGILFGITNTFANISGFLAPYVAGVLINNNPSLLNWQYVFFIAAVIYVIDTTFYAAFAAGSEQSWNRGSGSYQLENQNKRQGDRLIEDNEDSGRR